MNTADGLLEGNNTALGVTNIYPIKSVLFTLKVALFQKQIN